MTVEDLREIVLSQRPNIRIGIVYSRRKSTFADALVEGATERLLSLGVKKENIIIESIPLHREIPLVVRLFVNKCDRLSKPLDAVIPIGVLIKGSIMNGFTCNSLINLLRRTSVRIPTPVIFGLLTLTEAECGEKSGLIEESMYNQGERWGYAAVKGATKFT